MASFDRFDICEAYSALEHDWNEGGLIPARGKQVADQLRRIKFRGRPSLGGYSSLGGNAKEIYGRAAVRLKLVSPRPARIGGVSSGTMRPEDLIPTFSGLLAELSGMPAAELPADEEWYDSDEATEELELLFDRLNEYAPPYCHFGAHEGDGADYGFWVSWDSLEDDVRCGAVSKIEAGIDWNWCGLPETIEYVLEVNDHGNATLYGRESREEVWSIV